MLKIRSIKPADRAEIYELMQQDTKFSSGEIQATLNRIDVHLFDTYQKLYIVIKAANDKNDLLGYAVYGADPNAADTYNIYNLVKSPLIGNNEILSQLLVYIEDEVKRKRGRIIISEISSNIYNEYYRRIYRRQNFKLSTKIKDFYSLGEDKLILFKNLTQNKLN